VGEERHCVGRQDTVGREHERALAGRPVGARVQRGADDVGGGAHGDDEPAGAE